MVLVEVETQPAEPRRLVVGAAQRLGGEPLFVVDDGVSTDEVAVAGVAQPARQVEVLIPEEEALVEAAHLLPDRPAEQEAGPGRLPDLDRPAPAGLGDRPVPEAADQRSQRQRGARGQLGVVGAVSSEGGADQAAAGAHGAERGQRGKRLRLGDHVRVGDADELALAVAQRPVGTGPEAEVRRAGDQPHAVGNPRLELRPRLRLGAVVDHGHVDAGIVGGQEGPGGLAGGLGSVPVDDRDID